CLPGFETGCRSPARKFVRGNETCRPEWLSDPAPALRSSGSALRQGTVRSPIFRPRKPAGRDVCERTAGKYPGSTWPRLAPPPRFRAPYDLPATETRSYEGTSGAAFPSERHLHIG